MSLLIFALGTVLPIEARAQADQLSGSRFKPQEVRHYIRVVLDRGFARLTVERTFYNPGDRPDQIVLEIAPPNNAVATGLRTLGNRAGRPHWFEGELLEAETAAARYQELTGIGGYYPKDPALLSWRSEELLMLQVFPCFAKQNKVVGYTFELPLEYKGGRYYFPLSPLGLPERPATFTFRAARPGDTLFFGDRPLRPGSELVPTQSDDAAVTLAPLRPPPVDGELAVADTGLGQNFAHTKFALAAQLSDVPRDAYVVLGLDNSRSLRHARADVVAMAKATMEHFKNAQVQILDFARRPNPRFSAFTDKRTALASLKREGTAALTIESGNGSEIDVALAEAERLLAAMPSTVPKRILFFTDAMVPERITVRALSAAATGSDAIVHIVQVPGRPKNGTIARDDEHAWAAATRQSGGLFWRATPDDDCEACVELVRPTRLDKALYETASESEELGTLAEGDGLERRQLVSTPLRWASLSGELWSKPYRVTVHPNSDANKRWSALFFGQPELSSVSEAEMMVLARRGGAVSPVTSYLAIEPGVRPSTEGLDHSGVGSGMGFGSGHGRLGASHHAPAVKTAKTPFDPHAFLTELLQTAYIHCGGRTGTARVTLETHYVEIADVTVSMTPGDPTVFGCLEAMAWAVDLRGKQFDDDRRYWDIAI